MTDLNIQELFFQGIGTLWWAIPLGILWFIVDSSWFKGKLGEYLVARSFKKYLNAEEYTVLHDVTLPARGGTTQVDHIVVSPVWHLRHRNKEHERMDLRRSQRQALDTVVPQEEVPIPEPAPTELQTHQGRRGSHWATREKAGHRPHIHARGEV